MNYNGRKNKKSSSNSGYFDSHSVLPADGGKANTGSNQKQIDAFRKRVETLVGANYCLLKCNEYEMNEPNSAAAFQSAAMGSGNGISSTFNLFDSREKPKQVKGKGSEKKGYIPWGTRDDLPNQIYNYAGCLPYTAAAIKYLSDLTLGYGPKLMYHFIPMDGAKPEDIAYSDAGKRILAEICKIRGLIAEQKAAAEQNEQNDGEDGNITPLMAPSASEDVEGDENEIGSLAYFLKEYTEDYKRWQVTNAEYEEFTKYNDLNFHYMNCAMDDVHLDIYYPTIGLSIGKKDEPWHPKIVSVGFLPAACCRLEEKDEKQNINYVYYSELWRTKENNSAVISDDDIVAYPALMQESFIRQLEQKVKENEDTRVGSRPTWFCCPCMYPSMHKPYYPQPAWWSIFPTQTYDYATTLITDKAIARRNATMWGKLIFVNLEYLRQLYDDMEADTFEKKQEIRAMVMKRAEDFLSCKENSGKSLFADMYPSADGKTMLHAIEIVDVPRLAQSREMKDELEEVSSIIFFSIGVSPALIGSIPGAKSSSGGTFQRELHLLKQTQMSPRQRIYLRFLENISTFNGWDKKGVWQIAMPVLTTLDRNKTGIEEM